MNASPEVFLINPPFGGEAAVGASRSLRHVLNVIPPLGLAYCAAVLEKEGIRTELFDCSADTRALLPRLIEARPPIIGITASTPVFASAAAIAREIRARLPGSAIIIGGAHVTAAWSDAMAEGAFDAGVIGEGEITLLELVRHIRNRGLTGLGAVRGVVFREGGRVAAALPRGFIDDLDTLPYPARHLLPHPARYHPTPASYRRLPLGIMITSRGCPQRCTFCDRAVFGNAYRSRSAANVLGEVDELVGKYGCREIRFFDDCFALDKKRVSALCAGLGNMRKRVSWTCLTTVGSVDRDILREMKRAGCWQVLFGLESGNDRVLERLRKGATVEQNIRAVRLAKEAGLSVRADFICGTPGETRETMTETLEFALASGVEFAHFNKFVPFPGTELYAGIRAGGASPCFGAGSAITDDTSFNYIPESVGDERFYRAFFHAAHRKFYLRPGYILRRLFSLRTFDELCGQVRGFFSILFWGAR